MISLRALVTLAIVSGAFVITAQAQESKLVGMWLVEDIGGAGVIDNAQTTIGFEANGAVLGSGGCNRYRTRAKIGKARLTFSPAASTKKACVPALMDQETRFFAALGKCAATASRVASCSCKASPARRFCA